VRLFEQDLGAEYPFRALHAIGGSSGLALFSRYPLEVVEVPTQLVSCQCMVVESEINGRRVTLIIVHIWRPQIQYILYRRLPRVRKFDTRLQTPIFDQLIQQVTAVDGPLVVLGDLNTSERQPNYRRLRLHLQDAFAEAGWGMGYTFPATLQLRNWHVPPFVRIDHILVNEFWQTRAAWSGQLPTSDHGYVVADLGLVD
jgi:vancomycin resistance protein VanJ